MRLELIEALALPKGRAVSRAGPELRVVRLVKLAEREAAPAAATRDELLGGSELGQQVRIGLGGQQRDFEQAAERFPFEDDPWRPQLLAERER